MCMGMLPFAIYAAAAGAAGYLNPIPQPGEIGYVPEPQNHLRIIFENDSPSGRDRNYTHGTRIDYARTTKDGNAWGLSLMQNIYTPETHTAHAVPGEHPYCGYLALGAAYLQRGEQYGWAAELQLGVTGKASCAGRFQNWLHDSFRMDNWDGWDDQVPSEMTMELSLRQEWALPSMQRSASDGWEVDSRFVLREAMGTVRISGGAGLAFRVGHNLPPTTQAAANSATNYAIGLIRKPNYKPTETSYFLLTEMYMDYVARDITVDGGVFHHFDSTCSRTPWQFEGRVGMGVRHQNIDYFAGMLLLSRTYRTQDENSVMGTFSVSWNW